MENNISTVAYRSNLYPTSSISFREDRRFLAQVHDPFSLEQMKKQGLSLDSFQEKEYRQASVHCSYAFKDDYPWGTISMPDGKKTVVCRCTNTKCHLFVKCRPDFDLAELDVYDENKQSTALIFSLEKITPPTTDSGWKSMNTGRRMEGRHPDGSTPYSAVCLPIRLHRATTHRKP